MPEAARVQFLDERGAGLVVTAENLQDGRLLLYYLAPAILATKTERGWEMDFGYCLVRC